MIAPLHMLRLALGAVMAVTALAWFLPELLPFVRQAQWADPMTARLMNSLEASGLLAVAKFVQLVGGIALLLNRAVPFALAAMAAVNVCGAFVAVLIEGEAVLATLALLVLALNALLMLAHLDVYRGVLAQGALADGEGPEAGANYASLFTSPFAGAPTKACLIALVPLLAAAAFYWRVVLGLNSLTGLIVLLIPALALGAAWVRGARG